MWCLFKILLKGLLLLSLVIACTPRMLLEHCIFELVHLFYRFCSVCQKLSLLCFFLLFD